jgi:hypothetical protein
MIALMHGGAGHGGYQAKPKGKGKGKPKLPKAKRKPAKPAKPAPRSRGIRPGSPMRPGPGGTGHGTATRKLGKPAAPRGGVTQPAWA